MERVGVLVFLVVFFAVLSLGERMWRREETSVEDGFWSSLVARTLVARDASADRMDLVLLLALALVLLLACCLVMRGLIILVVVFALRFLDGLARIWILPVFLGVDFFGDFLGLRLLALTGLA